MGEGWPMKHRLGFRIRNIKHSFGARAGFPVSSSHQAKTCAVAVKAGSGLGGCGTSRCPVGKLMSTSELEDNLLPSFQVS